MKYRWILTIVFIIPIWMQASTAYILCEGNFMSGNSSLWHLNEVGFQAYHNNPIGDTGQSVVVAGNWLLTVMNGSNTVEVFLIDPDNGYPNHSLTISCGYNGPRDAAVHEDILFISQWNSTSVAVYDLQSNSYIEDIPVDGMPEDLLIHDGLLYVALTMSSDWGNINLVQVIDPATLAVITDLDVGPGPNQLLVLDNILYVSRLYYDPSWNAYAGMSAVNLTTQEILQVDYGQTSLTGADIMVINGQIYRTFETGVAPVSPDLQIVPENQIGNYSQIYTAAYDNGLLYFGVTDDYLAPDYLIVTDLDGNELGQYSLGALPGSIAFWNAADGCTADGDLNDDGAVDILDIVIILNGILDVVILTDDQVCSGDVNGDGAIDVLDVVAMVFEMILGLN